MMWLIGYGAVALATFALAIWASVADWHYKAGAAEVDYFAAAKKAVLWPVIWTGILLELVMMKAKK